MLNIHSNTPKVRYKRKIIYGAVIGIVGMIIGFGADKINVNPDMVLSQGILNFICIIAFASAIIGASVFLKGLFQYKDLLS